MIDRRPSRIVSATPTSDGAGVRLVRSLGSAALPMLDPFLLLDEFRSDDPHDYLAGFPDHPHRGFETVTYMLAGSMEHKDSEGNTGRLVPGSVQWMTAGRGIVHSEMPKQENGAMWGLQLWVNLPARLKMMAPRYQDIAPERVPVVEVDSARVRVLAGELGGARGPVEGIAVEPTMLDVTIPAGGSFAHALDAEHNAFVYVLEGSAIIAGERVDRGRLGVLGEGERVTVRSDDGGRLLLLSARPIRERVARYGPFVMSSPQEIAEAVRDYQRGRLVS